MKKTLLALAFLSSLSTQAAYLYWQVDSDSENTSSFNYNAARIGWFETSQRESYPDLATMEAAGKINYDSTTYKAGADGNHEVSIPSDLSSLVQNDLGAYSFFIELVNYNATPSHVAYGEALSYQELVEKNFVDTGMTVITPATVWHGGSYNAVPEPTSALMMLLGVAFLGLKRRRI